jgi:hypothetical protein
VSVLKLPLLVDLQQNLGELVLSITSFNSIIILGKASYQCLEKCGYSNFNSIIFLVAYSLACNFVREKVYEGGPYVLPVPMN